MRSRLSFFLLLVCLLAIGLASVAQAVPLTRQQAVAKLFDPGSGVVLDTTESTVWSPYFNFGAGAGFEGQVPAGSTVDPAYAGLPPYPGPGLSVSTPSYFFWVDDNILTHFEHAVRFILVDANNSNPTVVMRNETALAPAA